MLLQPGAEGQVLEEDEVVASHPTEYLQVVMVVISMLLCYCYCSYCVERPEDTKIRGHVISVNDISATANNLLLDIDIDLKLSRLNATTNSSRFHLLPGSKCHFEICSCRLSGDFYGMWHSALEGSRNVYSNKLFNKPGKLYFKKSCETWREKLPKCHTPENSSPGESSPCHSVKRLCRTSIINFLSGSRRINSPSDSQLYHLIKGLYQLRNTDHMNIILENAKYLLK